MQKLFAWSCLNGTQITTETSSPIIRHDICMGSILISIALDSKTYSSCAVLSCTLATSLLVPEDLDLWWTWLDAGKQST